MKILLVEDDYLQNEWISSNLQQEFPDAEIELLSTESEFYSHINKIAAHPPDVILIDVMLRWEDPSENPKPEPDEVRQEGFFRAGLRCERLLAKDARTGRIPVILYTMLESTDLAEALTDLPDNVTHMRKEPDLTPLFQRIRNLTRRRVLS